MMKTQRKHTIRNQKRKRGYYMKNLKLLPLIALLTLAISGCTAPVDEASADREKELENRIAELEQEITSLEKENVSTNSVTANDDTGQVASSEVETLDSLEKAVTDAVSKVDSATPSGTAQENQTKFFDLKNELDALDNKLDSHDDYLEAQYRQNLISYEEYRSQEKKLEKLEDTLENAEDRLERTFGIDD